MRTRHKTSIDPRHDWQEWADILKSAGLEHRGVHAQRHTAATLLLDQGVALAVVQEMLGHSDIRVTPRLHACLIAAHGRGGPANGRGAVGAANCNRNCNRERGRASSAGENAQLMT
jgi:hypothetical protein